MCLKVILTGIQVELQVLRVQSEETLFNISSCKCLAMVNCRCEKAKNFGGFINQW